MKEIKTLHFEKWGINYTATHLQIGCKNFPIEDWRKFSDKEIDAMDNKALEFWNKFKHFILMAIDLSPAVN